MKYCRICFQEIKEATTLLEYFTWNDVLCGKCRHQLEEKKIEETIHIHQHIIHVLYHYDDWMESMLFQLKEGRDIALAPIFLWNYQKIFRKRFAKYALVGVPSSKAKNKERGFYALEEMYKVIDKEIYPIFKKTKDRKQSMQNLQERANVFKVIALDTNVSIPNQPLLIIDDVCTSGATLLACFDLLKDHPYPVEAFVISVHPLVYEKYHKKKRFFLKRRIQHVRDKE